jgi:hypothetical protein
MLERATAPPTVGYPSSGVGASEVGDHMAVRARPFSSKCHLGIGVLEKTISDNGHCCREPMRGMSAGGES